MPVYELLGGKFRDRVRLYVDSAMTNCQNSAEEARSKGFTAIKFDQTTLAIHTKQTLGTGR